MIHKISVSAIVCALFAISMTAYAQGRPAGAGSQGGGGRPAMSQQQDRGTSMRQDSELRRQQSEARRLAAEEQRLAQESAHAGAPPDDAVQRRADGEAHHRSGDTPSGRQAPNAHAAPEAFAAADNAINATDHGLTRRVTGDANRETPDDDEPNDD